jgi:hypothetical protein
MSAPEMMRTFNTNVKEKFNKMQDKFKREVEVGDTIAVAVLQYRTARLRIGEIVKFTPAGIIKYKILEGYNKDTEHHCMSGEFAKI